MLEKPDIPETLLRDALHEHYRIVAQRIAFLPFGNDENSALYRVDAAGGPIFLKVRTGDFDVTSATLPKFLFQQGVPGIIPPMPNERGQVWTSCDRFDLVLYLFVEGHTGFDVELTEGNWIDLGRALRALHETVLPPEIETLLRRETLSSRWRNEVRELLAGDVRPFDSATEELASFWSRHHEEIAGLVDRAEELALLARSEASTFVPCHGDIHGGNVLMDTGGVLYVVDWDTAVLAPKERDLMFIGGGIGGIWNDEPEAELFYQGYEPADVDAARLAYYRYDRIVEDIAVTSREIASMSFSERDRQKWARGIERQFAPRNVVEMAHVAYQRLSR